jgi:hypothetical protein
MPRDGAIIFGDLVGKLDVLVVECPKCGRAAILAWAAVIDAALGTKLLWPTLVSRYFPCSLDRSSMARVMMVDHVQTV